LLVSVIYFVTDCFQLEDVRWSLNLQTASDAQAKQVIPKAVFQFGLKTDENVCDNVTVGFTHKELYEFYKHLETIQSQLDELH
jgi:hydroxylamine reductase (hybrid-cluster protein)